MYEKKVNLLGLELTDLSVAESCAAIEKRMIKGECTVVFTPNIEMLEAACKREALRRVLCRADMLLPDGVGLKLVARLLGVSLKNIAPGIEVGEEILKISERRGYRVFLLGADVDVARLAKQRLKKIYPRLKVCGTYHGFFKNDDIERLCDMISGSRAEVLLVCMGFPKQERFAFKCAERISSLKLVMCLGGALDVWSGTKHRAPQILRDVHLEWLYRIACEPKRLNRFLPSLTVLLKAVSYRAEKILSKELR